MFRSILTARCLKRMSESSRSNRLSISLCWNRCHHDQGHSTPSVRCMTPEGGRQRVRREGKRHKGRRRGGRQQSMLRWQLAARCMPYTACSRLGAPEGCPGRLSASAPRRRRRRCRRPDRPRLRPIASASQIPAAAEQAEPSGQLGAACRPGCGWLRVPTWPGAVQVCTRPKMSKQCVGRGAAWRGAHEWCGPGGGAQHTQQVTLL